MSALAPSALTSTPNPQTSPGVQAQLTGAMPIDPGVGGMPPPGTVGGTGIIGGPPSDEPPPVHPPGINPPPPILPPPIYKEPGVSGDPLSSTATYVPPPAAPPPSWNFDPGVGLRIKGNGPLALPPAPLAGAAGTDATYLAQEAMLRHQIETQYADLLQQLGYSDPKSGQFIPGSIEINANMRREQMQRQLELENQNVTQNTQQNGILFSGMRGTMLAQAQEPTMGDIGQLEYQTPQDLAAAYNHAMDLANQYNEQNSMLIADAAIRATGGIDKHPPYTAPPPAYPTPINYGTGGLPITVSDTSSPLYGQPNPLFTQPNVNPAPAPPPAPTGTPLSSNQGGGGGRGVVALEGGEVTQPTTVHMGEISTPGDRMSHEVVVPRYRLTPKQNRQLDKILDTAGIATATKERLAA